MLLLSSLGYCKSTNVPACLFFTSLKPEKRGVCGTVLPPARITFLLSKLSQDILDLILVINGGVVFFSFTGADGGTIEIVLVVVPKVA